jgi:hypothetical protein
MFQTFPIHLLTSQTPKRKSYIGVCMCAYGFYFDSIFIPTYWSLLELEPHMFLLLNFTFNSRIGTLGTPKIEERRCFPLAHLFSLHIWMCNFSQNIWDKKKVVILRTSIGTHWELGRPFGSWMELTPPPYPSLPTIFNPK